MIASAHSHGMSSKVVGVIPAAGQGSRIAPLPCSKELYPIGFRPVESGEGVRPKVVCHYLLDKMRLAGVTEVFIVLRHGKWDIPAYLGDGRIASMNIAYLMMRLPWGPPFTLDQAYAFVQNDTVVFGFPDILFQPDDAFVQLLDRRAASGADVVLGLFPAHNPQYMDMVEIDAAGHVQRLDFKPHRTTLRYAWVCAVWGSAFTQFIHDYVRQVLSKASSRGQQMTESSDPDLSVGTVIQAAIEKGLQVDGVSFPEGTYLDIGTPEGLAEAMKRVSS